MIGIFRILIFALIIYAVFRMLIKLYYLRKNLKSRIRQERSKKEEEPKIHFDKDDIIDAKFKDL